MAEEMNDMTGATPEPKPVKTVTPEEKANLASFVSDIPSTEPAKVVIPEAKTVRTGKDITVSEPQKVSADMVAAPKGPKSTGYFEQPDASQVAADMIYSMDAVPKPKGGWFVETEEKKGKEFQPYGALPVPLKSAGVVPQYKYNDPTVSKEEWDSMSDYGVKQLAKDRPDIFSDNAKLADYANAYAKKVVQKDGYYLTERQREYLAKSFVNQAADLKFQKEQVIPALRNKLGELSNNQAQAASEISKIKKEADLLQKSYADKITPGLEKKYKPELDAIYSERESFASQINAKRQAVYDRIAPVAAQRKADEMMSQMSEEQFSAYMQRDGDAPSQFEKDVYNDVINSQEFKSDPEMLSADEMAKKADADISVKVKGLNKKMIDDFDFQMSSYSETVKKDFDAKIEQVRSKFGGTQDVMKTFYDTISSVYEKNQEQRYAFSKQVAYSTSPMGYAPLSAQAEGWAAVGSNIGSSLTSLYSSIYNTFAGTYVNKMDVDAAVDQMNPKMFDPGLLIEKDGWWGGINIGSISALVGSQAPNLALSMVGGIGAAKTAYSLSNMLNMTVRGTKIFGAAVGGLTNFEISKALNAKDVKERAIREGLTPNQIDSAVNKNSQIMNYMMPLYVLEMGAILSPALKFTDKMIYQQASELVQENLENLSGDISIAKAKNEYKGLFKTINDYISGSEFTTTNIATFFTGLGFGGGISHLGTNVGKKAEKAALMNMFQHYGKIVPEAALDMAHKNGNITDQQREDGIENIRAMETAANRVAGLDLTNDAIRLAAMDKIYDLEKMNGKLAKTQDETEAAVIKEKIEKSKAELKDIISESAPVYVMQSGSAPPVILSKSDMDSNISDPEFIRKVQSGEISVDVVNDSDTNSKIKDAVSKYKEVRKEAVSEMNVTEQKEGRISVKEAKELVDLKTKQRLVEEQGGQLDEKDVARIQQLSAKGKINLQALEQSVERKRQMQGATMSYIQKTKEKLQRTFKGTNIITDKAQFVSAATEVLKGQYKTDDIVFDNQSNSFIINGSTLGANAPKKSLSSIRGWNNGDGNIYINQDGREDKDTLIHEIGGHGWVNEMIKKSTIEGKPIGENQIHSVQDIYDADDSQLNEFGRQLKIGLNLIKGTEYHEELKLNDFYNGKPEAEMLEEALVQAIGESGAKIQSNALSRFTNWLKSFVKLIMGDKYIGKNISDTTSLSDFLNGAVSDVLGMQTIAEFQARMEDQGGKFKTFPDKYKVEWGDFEKTGFEESEEFKKLKELGIVELNFDIRNIAGKNVVVIVPDNMITGVIKSKDGSVDITGDGGVQFVLKFGDVWSSSGMDTAQKLCDSINEALDKNIKDGLGSDVYIILSKGRLEKSLTSHDGAKSAMKVIEYLVDKGYISTSDFRKALISSGKKYNINFSGRADSKSIRSDISKNFFGVSNSSFNDRGYFIADLIGHIAKNSESAKKNVKQIKLALNSAALGRNIQLKKAGIIESIGLLLSDSFTKGVAPSNTYAAIHVKSKVYPIDMNLAPDGSIGHQSYPAHIKTVDGSRPRLLMLNQNEISYNVLNDVNNKPVPQSFINKEGKNTSGVVKLGSNQVGYARAVVKPASELPAPKPKFQAEPNSKLEGNAVKPTGKLFVTPHREAESVMASYVSDKGLSFVKKKYVKAIDITKSMAIADYFDTLKDMSDNAEVMADYIQMGKETLDQFDHMVSKGYKIEVYRGEGEPYKVAGDMIKDLDENKHLFILATENEYGTGVYNESDPLLQKSGRYDVNGYELLNNDLFRAVHDFFGHAVMGNGFGPVGEENAWLIHSQMYTESARRAMTSETRLQNSWVNFNGNIRRVNEDGSISIPKPGDIDYIPLSKRPFAKQMKVSSPDWIVSTDAYINQDPIIGDDTQAKFSVVDKDHPDDDVVNAIRNSKIYGHMTEDGKGNFVFFHCSPKTDLDKKGVDPQKFGANVAKTSAEERMRSVPVSMYYTEEDVSDVPYTQKYFVRIPKDKVYYFNADPLGLAPAANQAFRDYVKKKGYDLAYSPNEQIGFMLQEAKKLGYEMIIAKWGNGLVRAETDIKMKPTKLYHTNGNIVEWDHRERFTANRKVGKKKVSKSDKLASERDYGWYSKAVDALDAAPVSKDELIDKLQTGKFVIITPENPNNQDYFEYENDNLVNDFEDEMRLQEVEFTPIIGRYGRYERSYVVFDASKTLAKKLCKKFNQESVATDFGLYYVESNKFNPRVLKSDKFSDGEMESSDDYMSTIMTTDGPVSFSIGYDFEKEKTFSPKAQVIGIEGAKSFPNLVSNYKIAMSMEYNGASPRQVYLSTGWFRDFAGNMAYETDDINVEVLMYPTEEGNPIGQVISHDEIFQMYPDSKNIVVKLASFEDDTVGQFYYEGETPVISVNPEKISEDMKDELKELLFHEIQHYIQRIEGVDGGSNISIAVNHQRLIRDYITSVNDTILSRKTKKLPEKLAKYIDGIEVDVASLEFIEKIIKDNKDLPEGAVPYYFDFGEMVARYVEKPLSKKEIKNTPLARMMPTGFFALSLNRIQNIHEAFISQKGKIKHGPGQKINIPGFKVEDDNVRRELANEKIARGLSIKAAIPYYTGTKETPDQREERMALRDQIMLELYAAQDAYRKAMIDAGVAKEYEGRKRDIEEAFRTQEITDKLAAKFERKIRREQIISAFRWLAEKEKWQDKISTWEGFKELIISRIDDYRKDGSLSGKINARTLATFSKMILNANTEKRMNKALAYLDKALGDKRYGDLIAAIRDRKATIKGMMRGSKNPFGNMYSVVNEIITYNESDMFDPYSEDNFAMMEMYLNIIDSIATRNIPNFRAYTNDIHLIKEHLERAVSDEVTDDMFSDIGNIDQLNYYADRIYSEEINNDIEFIKFRKLVYSLNRQAGKLYQAGLITDEEFDQIAIKMNRKSRSREIEQEEIRQKVQDYELVAFNSAKRIINSFNVGDNYSGYNQKAIEKLRNMINSADGFVDFQNTGTDSIILLEKVVDQITNGFVSPAMYKLMTDVEVEKTSTIMSIEISQAIKERNDLKLKGLARKYPQSVTELANKLTGIPKQIVDQALSLGKKKTYYNNIAYEMSKSFTGIRDTVKTLNGMIHRKMMMQTNLSAEVLSGKVWLYSKSRYRIGIILKQLDYQSNIVDFENSNLPKDVVGHLLREETSRMQIDSKELSNIEEAYNSLPKNADGTLNIDEALKSLTKEEKALYDTIRDVFDNHIQPMMEETNARRGEIAENQSNYYRRFAQGERMLDYDDDMTPSSIVRRLETYKVRSGSTKGRVTDGLYWTKIDPQDVMFRAINEIATDYHLSQAVPKAMSILKATIAKTNGEARTVSAALQILTRNTLIEELTINNDAGEFSLIAYANQRARRILLSSPTRFFTEMVPSLVKGFISNADSDNFAIAFKKFGQDGRLYKKLYYDLSLPFKDNIGMYTFEGGESGRQSKVEAATDFLSTMSDIMYSKFVFKTEFDAEFMRITGEEFDIKRYNDDNVYAQNMLASGVLDQAAKVALYKTERLASSLSQFTAPIKIANMKRSGTKSKILGFMQSYNAFEQKMFLQNFRDVVTGENEGRLKAARNLFGVVSGGMAYSMMGYFITQLFKEIGGDDDEPISEEIKDAFQATIDGKSAKNLFFSSCINTLMGGYGQIGKIGLGILYGILDAGIKAGWEISPENKKRYNEMEKTMRDIYYFKKIDLSSTYGTKAADALSMFTLFGIYITPTIDTGLNYLELMKKREKGEVVTTEDEELQWNIITMTHALANLAGLSYPGMAMVHRSLKYAARDEAQKAKKLSERVKEKKAATDQFAPTAEQLKSMGLDVEQVPGNEIYNTEEKNKTIEF